MAVVSRWYGTGLAEGDFTVASVGTDDTAPNSVTGAANVDVIASTLPGLNRAIGVVDGTGLGYGSWILSDLNAFALRFYMRRLGDSTAIFAQINDTAGDKLAGFDCTTSGMLRLSTKAGGVNANSWVGTLPLPTDGTWLRCEYKEDAAGNWTVAYYNGHDTTPVETGSGTKTHQVARTLQLGRLSGAVATSGLAVAGMAIGNSAVLLGPAVTAADTAVYSLTIGHAVNSAALAARSYTVDASNSSGPSATLTQQGGTQIGTIVQSPPKVFTFADPGGTDDLVLQLVCGTASRMITIPRTGANKPAVLSYFGGGVGVITNWG